MASVTSTLLTVGGTPTVFLPLPTPYTSHSNCASNIYSGSPDTFLAWDPVFGQVINPSATICIAPQITTWWLQSATNPTYTALGPTFACPEAYSTITTSKFQTSWEEVYCCPSSFSLLALQPNTAEYYPSQCISLLTKGQTLSYVSNVETDGTTFVVTTSTTVLSAATVFGGPVNGFNLATSTSTSSKSSASAPASSEATSQSPANTATPQETSSSSSSSLSRGQTIGIAVGVALGVALIGICAFIWWWRRRKRRQAAAAAAAAAQSYMGPQELPPNNYVDVPVRQPSPAPKELDTQSRLYELPGTQYK